MEALLIINSVLAAVSLYFVKDFHKDFKEMAHKVGKLREKVKSISIQLKSNKRLKP